MIGTLISILDATSRSYFVLGVAVIFEMLKCAARRADLAPNRGQPGAAQSVLKPEWRSKVLADFGPAAHWDSIDRNPLRKGGRIQIVCAASKAFAVKSYLGIL